MIHGKGPDGTPVAVAVDSVGNLTLGSATASQAGGTLTDKTITSLSGSSQTLVAANAARKGVILKNGTNNAGVNILGGTAAIGGAGCMTFTAFDGAVLMAPACGAAAITVIGTPAAYFTAIEIT